MSISCFSSWIGVRGCSSTSPSSGLYIDDLPGINLDRAAKVVDSATGTELLQKCVTNGVNKTKQDVMLRLSDVVTFNKALEDVRIGRFDVDEYHDADASSRGVKIKKYQNCKYSKIKIVRVDVLANTSTDTQISIVDGEVSESYDIALVEKQVASIYPNKTCELDEVKVLMDNTSILTNKTDLYNLCECDNTLYIESIGGSGTYGLRVHAQLVCDTEAILCEVRDFMANAAWYQSGIWFLDEFIASSRLNEQTIYTNETIGAIKDQYTANYEKELDLLKETLPKVLKTNQNCCLECNSSHWTTGLP